MAYTLAVNLTRKINNKEQRIIVAGDADFMSTKLMGDSKIDHGFYSWGLYNQYPVYATRRLPEDRHYKINSNTAAILSNIYVYLIPAVVCCWGPARFSCVEKENNHHQKITRRCSCKRTEQTIEDLRLFAKENKKYLRYLQQCGHARWRAAAGKNVPESIV